MAASNLALSSGLAHSCKNAPIQQAQSQRAVSPIVHLVAPSSRLNNGDDEAEMRPPTSGKTSGVPSENEVRDKIATALRVVPSAKHVVQRFAVAEAKIPSVDTAEGWRAGLNTPGGYNLIVLARQFPEVRAVVRQLIDSDFDADPRAYALFVEAMSYAQRGMK